MNWDLILAFFAVIFSGGIFLIGFLSLLLMGLNRMLKPIEKQLSNHVSDTDKKIEKLAEGQARLEGKLDLLLKDRDKK